ncbi:hypothetical protein [Pedosphaera parvula]|uniref:Uncharacterized protein n=1 Tax=Pedosphaera parvula (strain Ellin514) TaxID=320771 RepID=B9XEQ8_PEDPL|nr:hypothetical protein [Pedosphaera parvula]EEF61772.1 hypothetical protein Cflav_PD4812 [Pedosphaera parvula Ellin514]
MLRRFVYLLALLANAGTLMAAGSVPALDNLGQSFYSKGIQVKWEIKTNPFPQTVRIFEIVPHDFSQNVVSNMMRLGAFTEADRTGGQARGVAVPAGELNFRGEDAKSFLSIAPGQGHIKLSVPNVSTDWPTKVPDQSRAMKLGTSLLKLLEIPTAELVTGEDDRPKAWFYPGVVSGFDKGKKEFVEVPSTMGIEFRRQLDHILCGGDGIHLQFETGEKLTQLEVNWHSVKPSKPCKVATIAQITSWIKEGRARVASVEVQGSGGRRLRPAEIKKLTIREATLNYSDFTYPSPFGFDEQIASQLYPYAALTAVAELQRGDWEVIYLFVPVTTEALTQVSRKSDQYGFGIYPSRRYQRN